MNLHKILLGLFLIATTTIWGQANNDITLTVRNQNQNGTDFTFDVYANTTSGTTYLGDADIAFSTSATKWSSIAVASSNVQSDISTLSASIVGSDVVVNVQGNFAATATSDFPAIGTTPVRLFTLTLTTVSDFTTTPDIAFVTSGNPRTIINEVYQSGSRLRQSKINSPTLTAPAAGTAPAAAPANFAGDFSTPSQATLSWDAATDSVLIIARAGSAVANGPINTVKFNADNNFGDGDALNTAANVEYVVGKYDGTATSAVITGLSAGTVYHFAIYKYSGGSGRTEAYGSAATVSGNSIQAEPTSAASNIAFANIGQTSFDVTWTQGDGDNVLVVVRLDATSAAAPSDQTAYTANTSFSAKDADSTGVGNYVLLSASNTGSLSVTGLTAGQQYTVEIYEFNGTGADNNYLTSSYGSGTQYSMFPEPSTSFAGITAATQSATSIDVTWTDPSESDNQWLIIARLSTDAATAPTEGTAYTADAAYTSGTAIGNGYVVYNGNGSSGTVSITGLDQNETYAFDIYAYTGTAASDDNVLNYSNSADDNSSDVTWLNADITITLEGAYNGTDMAGTNITVPSSQPYNTAPWNYSTATTNTSGLGTVVDWVLVELRSGASASAATTVEYTQAALLLADGSVVGADGNALTFETANEGTYYIAVHHRNHIAASSAAALTDNGGTSDFSYNFNTGGATGTDGMFDYNGDASLYVLYGGLTDASTNTTIDSGDYSAVYSDRNTSNAYSDSDANLDGVIDAADRAIVFNNRDYSSQVPQ